MAGTKYDSPPDRLDRNFLRHDSIHRQSGLEGFLMDVHLQRIKGTGIP